MKSSRKLLQKFVKNNCFFGFSQKNGGKLGFPDKNKKFKTNFKTFPKKMEGCSFHGYQIVKNRDDNIFLV